MHPADLRALIVRHFDDVLVDARIAGVPNFSRGKVRDCYDLDDGRRILVTTDRQSAFDQVLAAVPFKGQVLTATARFWFEATGDIIANHALEYPDANIIVARRLSMLPVEVVVRDYLTGTTSTSIWPMYAAGQRRMYGISFADGLRRNEKLPATIITPTTKAGIGSHDAPIAAADIVASGLLTRDVWQRVQDAALALFDRGRTVAARNGLILVDTKYEFGVDQTGAVIVADEIHTPDSSRYWLADSYAERFAAGEDPETLDKDFLRRWIITRCDPYREPVPSIPAETLVEFAERYVMLFERVTGLVFAPPPAAVPVGERVRRVLSRYL
jgi:phosphoribosylaminoimidazole-succinocarboxamide synthase